MVFKRATSKAKSSAAPRASAGLEGEFKDCKSAKEAVILCNSDAKLEHDP